MIWLQFYLAFAGAFMILAWLTYDRIYKGDSNKGYEKIIISIAIGLLWIIVAPIGLLRKK